MKINLSRIDGNKSFLVTNDSACLREGKGFWSKKSVLYNPSSAIVLLRPITIEDIRGCVSRILDLQLESAVFQRLKSVSRKQLLVYFSLSNLPGFQSPEFRVGGHPGRMVQVDKVLGYIKKLFPGDETKQKCELSREICAAYRLGNQVISPLHMGADNITALTHPGLNKIIDSKSDGQSAITSLVTISRYNSTYQKNKDDVIKKNIIESNRSAELELNKCGVYSSGVSPQWIVALVASVRMTLAILTRDQMILLPNDFFGMALSMRALCPNIYELVAKRDHYWVSILLASSTVNGYEDIPSEFHQWADGISNQNSTNKILGSIIEKYQKLNKLPSWPLGGLHRGKSRANKSPRIWSLEWMVIEGFSVEWIAFAKLANESSSAGNGTKLNYIKFLLKWVKYRGFDKPQDITVTDLYDPFKPNDENTFAEFIRINTVRAIEVKKDLDKYNIWIRTSGLMRRVFNQLKVQPNPTFKLSTNPFEFINPPFRPKKNSGTPRARLPTNIHEAMIEVLLGLDENGYPTYSFVKDHLGWDWYDSIKSDTDISEKVWCPSRAACLALLLILPFRSKQARWLDRGLMDTRSWNIDSSVWERNKNPLREFRYPNGQSHIERYGRNTGVLQPVSNHLGEDEQLGIFINTNKTQMWNQGNITGYEVPWPSINSLSEVSSELEETARWLDRPYVILRQQLQWQSRYNPCPIPVGYMDSSTERDGVDERYAARLPLFSPVFADMSSKFYRNDNGSELIYLPVQSSQIHKLFNALAFETEKRLKEQGHLIDLTKPSKIATSFKGRVCKFDVHSLRVAGISRLIEMGIPAHIIQQYIVGHRTVVMTYHYNKSERDYLLKSLLNSNPVGEESLLGSWNSLRPELVGQKTLWVSNPRYAPHRPDNLLGTYTGWKLVPGGICPLGGLACDEGQLLGSGESTGKDSNPSNTQYGPVQGGCGNCRFFSTGPAFLIHQAQVANEIMLSMRALGKQRNALYKKLGEVNSSDIAELDFKVQRKVELNRRALKDQIEEIDLRLEQQILEWVNRYLMFQESQKLTKEWREFASSHGSGTERCSTLSLISGIETRDLQAEIDVRLSKTSDFTLVRSILEGATLRGGLAKASTIAKNMMSEFVDLVLRSQSSRRLLLDVRNDEQRYEAAFHIATLASLLVGDDAVESTIKNGQALPLDSAQEESWSVWIEKILAENSILPSSGAFIPIIPPQNLLKRLVSDECS